MRRALVVLLLSTVVGCKSNSSSESSSGASTKSAATAKSLEEGDSGTFVHVVGKREVGKETFTLARDGKNWKLVIDSTDSLNRFHHEIWLDGAFRFVKAKSTNNANTSPPKTAAAVFERGSNGNVAERGMKLDGNAYETYSSAPPDWYIPELGASAWFAACRIAPTAKVTKAGHPRVSYEVEPAADWSVDGRELVRRTVHAKVLATSTVVVVCDDGQLVAVGTHGDVAVRDGNMAIADALAALPEVQAPPPGELSDEPDSEPPPTTNP